MTPSSRMKQTKNTPKQWAIFSALSVIGCIVFCVLCGEDNPDQPMSLGAWIAVKGAAIAALDGLCRLGKHLYHKDLLPELEDEPDTTNPMRWED